MKLSKVRVISPSTSKNYLYMQAIFWEVKNALNIVFCFGNNRNRTKFNIILELKVSELLTQLMYNLPFQNLMHSGLYFQKPTSKHCVWSKTI